jgi:hypothetical protein
MVRCTAAALLLLALVASGAVAASGAAAHSGDAVFNALASSSRSAALSAAARHRSAAARALASLRPLLVPTDARRRLGDGGGGSTNAPAYCGAELPCVQKMQNATTSLAFNTAANASVPSWMSITDPALCPVQQADTDKCFYVRAPARAACAPARLRAR